MNIRIGRGSLGALAALLMTPWTARAGVTVLQNVSPGATNWPGSPLISTPANPSTATTGESFNSSNTNISQTFTITTTNYTLQTIDLYVGGGSGTGTGTNITLNLYDLGAQTAPNPNPYTSSILGANLLGSGSGLSITYHSQANGVLEFDFTGVDQAYLQLGHVYAFELSGVQGTSPIFWERSGSDTYSGGAAYRNQGWINGTSARDFAFAVYGVVNTNPPPAQTPTPPGFCVVDWSNAHQRIDGFGASSAWRSTWTNHEGDMFFSTNTGTTFSTNGTAFSYTGIGLSLLRNHIRTNDNVSTVETNIMLQAQARGARVWSTPWTPPALDKSNNSFVGGTINSSAYLGYARTMATYIANMRDIGGSTFTPSPFRTNRMRT